MEILLLAQTVDILSGAGGWAGAGLLGLVLGWLLLKHLPDKDKQIMALLEMKDGQIKEMLAKKWEVINNLTHDFRETVKEITAHCDKELEMVTREVTKRLEEIKTIVLQGEKDPQKAQEELANLLRGQQSKKQTP